MWDELLTPMEEATQAMHAWAVAEVEDGGIAPIFGFADVGIVGAGHEVVPALLEELRAQRT